MDPAIQGILAHYGAEAVPTPVDESELWGRRGANRIYEWREDSGPLYTLDMSFGDIPSMTDAHVRSLHAMCVRKLYITDAQLMTLPGSAECLSHLEEIFVHGNKLSTIPVSLCKVANLTTLTIRGSELHELPDAIGSLTNLTVLYLSYNKLTSVPETIGQLTKLREIFLHDNRLSSLPESIGMLANLEQLRLDSNKLTELPDTIGQLTKLTTLYLYLNELTSLPESMDQLRELKELYLDDNNLPAPALCAVAEMLRRSTTLRRLFACDCPGSSDITVLQAFERALRSNGSVQDLELMHVNETQDETPAIYNVILAATVRNKQGHPAPEPYQPLIKSALKR